MSKRTAKRKTSGKAAKQHETFMLLRHHKGHQAGETFTRDELTRLGVDPDAADDRTNGPLVVPARNDDGPARLGTGDAPPLRRLSLERTGSANARKVGDFAW